MAPGVQWTKRDGSSENEEDMALLLFPFSQQVQEAQNQTLNVFEAWGSPHCPDLAHFSLQFSNGSSQAV